MSLNTKTKKTKKAQKGITQTYTDMANFVNANVQAGSYPEAILAGWYDTEYPTIPIQDNRTTLAVSGNPIRPNRDRLTGNYPSWTMVRSILAAQKEGLDPYDMLAIPLKETQMGKLNRENPGHLDYRNHKNLRTDLFSGEDLMAQYFKKGVEKYPDNELLAIQNYNGLGTLGRTNDLTRSGRSDSAYGMPIPKEGFNMRKNPLYGKNHVDIRDNVLRQDPNVQQLIQNLSNYQATYDPEQQEYLNRQKELKSKKKLQEGGIINTTGYLDNVSTNTNLVNIIPSNHITMNGVSQPIYANGQLLQPNSGDYIFDTPYVIEEPAMNNKIKVKIKGIKANNGISIGPEGDLKPLSNNPYSQSQTAAIVGPTHAQDGVRMNINGQSIEAEGGGYNKQGELINTNSDQSVTIFSKKTKVPGTNISFADEVRDITKQENRLTKQLAKYGKKLDKATAYINQSDPYSPVQAPTYNTGIVNRDAALQNSDPILNELQVLSEAKEGLSVLQDMVNHDNKSTKAEKGLRIAQQGTLIPGTNIRVNEPSKSTYKRPKQDEYYELAYNAAQRAGVDPRVFTRLVTQESGWNPKVGSGRGAKGIVQFTPDTAKQYGIEGILNSDKPEDIERVLYAGAEHFGKLLNQFGGDYNAALLSYNAGPGSKSGDKGYLPMRRWAAQRLGKNPEDVTGAEVLSDLRNRRTNNPSEDKHAYHNESLDYVTSIMGYDGQQDYTQAGDFNKPVRAIPSYGGSPSVPLYNRNSRPKQEPLTALEPIANNLIPVNITPESVQRNTPNLSNTLTSSIRNQNPRNKTSLADSNRVGLAELLPSVLAATQRPDPVPHQSYTPTLYNPYTVSYQDQLNRINSTYQTSSRAATNNPAMQYALASQKYQADSQVLGEQFRTNQQIQNQVTNQNNQLLNQSQTINLQLQNQQIERQAKSVANTRSQRYQALANIANTYSQNRRDNNNIRLMESVSDYRYNPNTGRMEYQGEDQDFSTEVKTLRSESGTTIHRKYSRLFRK